MFKNYFKVAIGSVRLSVTNCFNNKKIQNKTESIYKAFEEDRFLHRKFLFCSDANSI